MCLLLFIETFFCSLFAYCKIFIILGIWKNLCFIPVINLKYFAETKNMSIY